ncbi:MAG: 3-hydroxyacyl-ACP dehydratase FabZ family protein [Thermodesulfovibrionales bacterium]
MRYLLVDQITEWQKGSLIRGIKNIAMSEDFLEFHFPKNPIMPGVMLIESIVQLTGWLEAASSDFSSWFLVNRVLKSNFYSFALPGDQVELEVSYVSTDDEGLRTYRGSGMVKGKKKVIVEFSGSLIPFDQIEDREEQRRFFQLLSREIKL